MFCVNDTKFIPSILVEIIFPSYASFVRSAFCAEFRRPIAGQDCCSYFLPIFYIFQLKGKLDMMNKQRARINEASDVRADRDALLGNWV